MDVRRYFYKMYNYQIDVDYDTTSKSETELIKYHKFYLQAMNLKEFDNKQINIIFDDLLPKLENNEKFKKLFKLNWNYPILDTNFTILINDFYYKDSAINLKNELIEKTGFTNISIKKINNNKYRLLAGPFKNFNALKTTYISLNNLGFVDLNINKN